MTHQGQVVVEYALLLVIAVSIAFLISTTLVSRDPNSPGFLIVKWHEIIQMIGLDQPEGGSGPP